MPGQARGPRWPSRLARRGSRWVDDEAAPGTRRPAIVASGRRMGIPDELLQDYAGVVVGAVSGAMVVPVVPVGGAEVGFGGRGGLPAMMSAI